MGDLYSSQMNPVVELLTEKEQDLFTRALTGKETTFEIKLALGIFKMVGERTSSRKCGSNVVLTSMFRILHDAYIPFTEQTLKVLTALYLNSVHKYLPYRVNHTIFGSKHFETIGYTPMSCAVGLFKAIKTAEPTMYLNSTFLEDLHMVKEKVLQRIRPSRGVIVDDSGITESFEELFKNKRKAFELSDGGYYFPTRKICDFSEVSDL